MHPADGSKRKLPLLNKTVYIDEVEVQKSSLRKLERNLTTLGASVEKFFTRDISYLITEHAQPNDYKSESHAKTDSSNAASPFALTPASATLPEATPTISSIGTGRSNSILAAAKKNRCQQNSTGSLAAVSDQLIKNAKQWSIGIIRLSYAIKWSDRKISILNLGKPSKLKKSRAHSATQSSKPNSTREKAEKILKVPYVKIQDLCLSKPLFRQYSTTEVPVINFNSTGCPFKSDDTTPNLKTMKSASVTSGRSVRSKKALDGRSQTGGGQARKKLSFCMVCKARVVSLDQHLQSESHRRFAELDENYLETDQLIDTGASVQRYQNSLNLCTVVSAPVPTHRLADENDQPDCSGQHDLMASNVCSSMISAESADDGITTVKQERIDNQNNIEPCVPVGMETCHLVYPDDKFKDRSGTQGNTYFMTDSYSLVEVKPKLNQLNHQENSSTTPDHGSKSIDYSINTVNSDKPKDAVTISCAEKINIPAVETETAEDNQKQLAAESNRSTLSIRQSLSKGQTLPAVDAAECSPVPSPNIAEDSESSRNMTKLLTLKPKPVNTKRQKRKKKGQQKSLSSATSVEKGCRSKDSRPPVSPTEQSTDLHWAALLNGSTSQKLNTHGLHGLPLDIIYAPVSADQLQTIISQREIFMSENDNSPLHKGILRERDTEFSSGDEGSMLLACDNYITRKLSVLSKQVNSMHKCVTPTKSLRRSVSGRELGDEQFSPVKQELLKPRKTPPRSIVTRLSFYSPRKSLSGSDKENTGASSAVTSFSSKLSSERKEKLPCTENVVINHSTNTTPRPSNRKLSTNITSEQSDLKPEITPESTNLKPNTSHVSTNPRPTSVSSASPIAPVCPIEELILCQTSEKRPLFESTPAYEPQDATSITPSLAIKVHAKKTLFPDKSCNHTDSIGTDTSSVHSYTVSNSTTLCKPVSVVGNLECKRSATTLDKPVKTQTKSLVKKVKFRKFRNRHKSSPVKRTNAEIQRQLSILSYGSAGASVDEEDDDVFSGLPETAADFSSDEMPTAGSSFNIQSKLGLRQRNCVPAINFGLSSKEDLSDTPGFRCSLRDRRRADRIRRTSNAGSTPTHLKSEIRCSTSLAKRSLESGLPNFTQSKRMRLDHKCRSMVSPEYLSRSSDSRTPSIVKELQRNQLKSKDITNRHRSPMKPAFKLSPRKKKTLASPSKCRRHIPLSVKDSMINTKYRQRACDGTFN